MRARVVYTCCLLALSLGWFPAAANAQDDPSRKAAVDSSSRPDPKGAAKKPDNRNGNSKAALAVTPEREAAVKTFVERNHPELVALLELLKESRPAEYERAIRELHRVTEKLALIQERDSQQYDLELKAWQVHSRIQLLVARLKMGAGDEVRGELKEAIAEQFDARVALLRHDRQKALDRLERIEKDISRLDGNRQELVDKQFDMLIRVHSESKLKTKPGGKNPAGKKSGKKPVAVSAKAERSGRQAASGSNRKP